MAGGTIRSSLFDGDRRSRHSRRASRRSSPRSSPTTSTSAASCKRGATLLASSTRRSPPTASRSPGAPATGRVLAAEFVNKGQTFSAMWFKDGDGKGAYFGLDGQSKQRSFLASPLEFSRVTSGFAMRMHPILNNWKQHNGVDYGAPVGTPVRTVGDGVVEFAGWQNGYGNVIQVQPRQRALDGLRAPEPHRRRQGPARRAGRDHRRRRPDRLGDRAAPALRGQDRRRCSRIRCWSRRRPRRPSLDAGVEGALRPAGAERPRPARRRRDAAAGAAARRVAGGAESRAGARRAASVAPAGDVRSPDASDELALHRPDVGHIARRHRRRRRRLRSAPAARARAQVLAHATRDFPPDLRAELLALNAPATTRSIAPRSPPTRWPATTPRWSSTLLEPAPRWRTGRSSRSAATARRCATGRASSTAPATRCS